MTEENKVKSIDDVTAKKVTEDLEKVAEIHEEDEVPTSKDVIETNEADNDVELEKDNDLQSKFDKLKKDYDELQSKVKQQEKTALISEMMSSENHGPYSEFVREALMNSDSPEEMYKRLVKVLSNSPQAKAIIKPEKLNVTKKFNDELEKSFQEAFGVKKENKSIN